MPGTDSDPVQQLLNDDTLMSAMADEIDEFLQIGQVPLSTSYSYNVIFQTEYGFGARQYEMYFCWWRQPSIFKYIPINLLTYNQP